MINNKNALSTNVMKNLCMMDHLINRLKTINLAGIDMQKRLKCRASRMPEQETAIISNFDSKWFINSCLFKEGFKSEWYILNLWVNRP
jgi:hypothetical protein